MNNIDPPSPAVPPQIQRSPTISPGLVPLGENPGESDAIPGFVTAIEAMLRQPRRVMYHLRQPGAGRLIIAMVAVAILCSMVYGVVVGTFSMGAQLWAAPLKIASGLLISTI